MKVFVFITGVLLATLLAAACLIAILIYFEPAHSGLFIFSLFYISVFISATGILSIIGLIIRRLSRRSISRLTLNRQLWDSFRQGMLLSLILVAALILQSKGLAKWWSLTVLVFAIGLIEFLAIRR